MLQAKAASIPASTRLEIGAPKADPARRYNPPFPGSWAFMTAQLIYLARGRPQRPRANLVQTLHTVEALALAGCAVRLYLPPVPTGFAMRSFLAGMGISHPIDLRPVQSLHSRWKGWPFVLFHRRELLRAGAVYTRVPEFSALLARHRIAHHLEVHDTASLLAEDLVPVLLDAQREGVLRGLTVITGAGRDALAGFGFAADRLEILPSGVDFATFAAVPAPTLDDFAEAHAMYIGRISHDRGLALFFEIARAGFPLTLIGPHDSRVRQRIPGLQIEAAIPHAQVPAALARGALALMPYQAGLRHSETISPIKLFEAMAARRLVIASDLAPIREIVRHGENGLLVAADDPAAWVAALAQVRADPARAAAMAAAGHETARAFDWSERARKLLAFVARTGAHGAR